LSVTAIFRQLCAKVRPEAPNAVTNRIWRQANSELHDSGRSLLVEPLANHQRESREQGHRVRQHHTNALLSHDAVDEVYQGARLGAAIFWNAAISAMPSDNVLPALTDSAGDPTPPVPSSSVDASMHGLDYEPSNTKEKWLMRIVYWRTIALVAFFLVGIRQSKIRGIGVNRR